MTPQINALGLSILKEREGLRLQAYPDTGGVPTIGYGHTHGVKFGDKCTKAQAEAWLLDDLRAAEETVARRVRVPLNDNQTSALILFAFNVGDPRFAGSTLLKQLNDGNYASVPTYLSAWVFSDGKVEPGLVKRRKLESDLWSKAV